jgi:hypothetical protein
VRRRGDRGGERKEEKGDKGRREREKGRARIFFCCKERVE